MEEKRIDKTQLLRQLSRAAQVRALLAMLACVVGIFVLGPLIPPQVFNRQDLFSTLVLLGCVFGPALLVSWLLTVTYCRPKVKCPHCQQSLWGCGSGNFKPRRMKIVKDRCPGCGAEIA